MSRLKFRGGMMRYLLLFSLVLLIACVKGPIATYPDLGVVEVTSDTVLVVFNVPDPDNNGWNPGGGGSTSKPINIKLKERADKDVSINSLVWIFYNADAEIVDIEAQDYIPPIEIEAGKEYSLTVTVTVDERIADNIDDHDGGVDDFLGNGTIEFYVEGYDLERGEEINSIPSYTKIQVQK